MSNIEYDTPELAEKYDRISNSQFENGIVLVDKLGINGGNNVLDIGCGTGRLALHAAGIVGKSGRIVGIDPSPLRIETARRKINDKSFDNTSFMVGRAEYLNGFADNSFDVAYLCAVFHWIADKKTALKEIHKVLKPGGRVGLTTGDKDNPFTLRQITNELFKRDPYAGQVNPDEDPNKPITQKELQDLFESTGYQDINITTKNTRLYFPTPQEVFDFIESSSFGTFLIHVPEHLRPAARHDIEKELEKKRTAEGIELVSNTIFTTAKKPLQEAN
ncbi:MAG: methyltransferase domain-containing protein [Candidatus Methanoperedens sp.]|nr:methyltransferase domain-containing protein [Candidatus Methanoperedens sp.]